MAEFGDRESGRQSGDVQGLHRFLGDVKWPARRGELQRVLREKGAPQQVMDRIRTLPDGQYDSEEDVLDALKAA